MKTFPSENDLPSPIRAYFTADKAKDAEQFRPIFANDAIVRDEDETHRGIDAIVAWKRGTSSKYTYIAKFLRASQQGKQLTVQRELTGNFPGSPVTLDYVFEADENQITSLSIL